MCSIDFNSGFSVVVFLFSLKKRQFIERNSRTRRFRSGNADMLLLGVAAGPRAQAEGGRDGVDMKERKKGRDGSNEKERM